MLTTLVTALVVLVVVVACCVLAGAKKPLALGIVITAAAFTLFWAAALTNGFRGYVSPAERLAKERAAYTATHPQPELTGGPYVNPECPWWGLENDGACSVPRGTKP